LKFFLLSPGQKKEVIFVGNSSHPSCINKTTNHSNRKRANKGGLYKKTQRKRRALKKINLRRYSSKEGPLVSLQRRSPISIRQNVSKSATVKLSKFLRDSPLYKPRVASLIEWKQRFSERIKHKIWKVFSTTQAKKGVFVVLKLEAKRLKRPQFGWLQRDKRVVGLTILIW
jgi:hypothetical protein